MLRRLLAKLNALPLREEDQLVFIGDYIDRGEDSRAVIEMLLEVQEQRPNTVFLRGNHEQLLLDARYGPPPQPSPAAGFILHSELTLNWLQNGGVDTLLSYGVTDYLRWWEEIPERHWEFFNATQSEYVTPAYHFVHAGLLPPGETWEAEGWDIDPRLWIREPFLSSTADFEGRVVVFGHTPQRSGQPLRMPNKIGIDTAAFAGGRLTAVAVDPEAGGGEIPPQFYQVEYAK